MGVRGIGLALGGGAARGWAHIGVIEALCEAGLEPSFIAGTSMGALVGGAYATGRLEGLKDWALSADRGRIMSLLDIGFSHGGLVEGRRIHELLKSLGIDGEMAKLPIPYAAVATHLADGQEVALREGSLADAIRASVAMPGIISPYRIGGRWLVDGGLVNQVPVSVCRGLGSRVIVAVSVGEGLVTKHVSAMGITRPDQRPARIAALRDQLPAGLQPFAERILPQMLASNISPGYFGTLAACMGIVQGRLTATRLASDPPDVKVAPLVSGISLLEFDRAAEAIEAGRAAITAALPDIRACLV